VLCDMIMPGIDGIATIQTIRKTHPTIRVYLFTGHPNPEAVYKNSGAHGFIKKPLDRDLFLDLMKRTLRFISLSKRADAASRRAGAASRDATQGLEQLAEILKKRA